MNVITATQNYIQRMVESVRGMKVLILDNETMGIVSSVFSQNEILQQEVYLFDVIDSPNREIMTHLKAICFLRPTQDNLSLLTDELKKPKYEQYHLFFSNILDMSYLEDLAHADEHEVVHQVQEYYADYFPINNDVFSLHIDSCVGLSSNTFGNTIDRICDGLASVLLSLKRKPLIRYEKSSEMAQRTAQELTRRMKAKNERILFDFGRGVSSLPVLLIIDRRSDPITPLLSQWTYQSMVHELLGIRNNRVIVPDVNKEGEIVLSQLQDEFYRDNLYSNFGDLGLNVKQKVAELQEHSKGHQNIQSIDDMKNFLQKYPEYQKLSSNVSKHVSLLSELSNIALSRDLYTVSELEQEIATKNDHSGALREISRILASHKVREIEKIKLLLLYTLRFEKNASASEMENLFNTFHRSGCDKVKAKYLQKALLLYGGSQVRSGDLLGDKTWVKLTKAFKSTFKDLQGATNVYTQHKPLLLEQLNDLVKGKLSEVEYPAMDGNLGMSREKPSDIIVFFVGGATYEEAAVLKEIKESPEFSNTRIVLGGTSIHNSQSFLREMRKLADGIRSS